MSGMEIIHPRCAIDENAIIFRSWVWLSPDHPPIKVEEMANSDRSVIGN